MGVGNAGKVWVPHEYQSTTEKFIYANTIAKGRPYGAALFLDPGLGKTSICLNAISFLRQFGYIRRALVIAPKRVATNVWPLERQNWQNFQHLSMGVAVGSPRRRKQILDMPYDVHVMTRDGVKWLADITKNFKGRLPWDLIIIDESTSFKTWGADRSKALRKLIPKIPFRIILTGTPAPKDLGDLYGQLWLLDEGETLGETVTAFRHRYCSHERDQIYVKGGVPKVITATKVREDMVPALQAAIQPLCLRLDARDHLSMPDIVYQDVLVDLPAGARRKYEEAEKELFLAAEEGERNIANTAALYGVCRQIANGGLYGNNREMLYIHDEKTDALLEVIEELHDKPVLIPYLFGHDAYRVGKKLHGVSVINGGMKPREFDAVIAGWNDGTLNPPHLMVQPQAMSFGINMQYGTGRDIFWYGMTDRLDDYLQLNARIWRQGVDSTVRIHRCIAKDTIDEMVRDRTDGKFDVQTSLLESLKKYREGKR